MTETATCKHCGAVHPSDTEYGDGCRFHPETWPPELQAQADNLNDPQWHSVPWPRGRGSE